MRILLERLLAESDVHLILDFDGTLIPIRDDRSDLTLSPHTKHSLSSIRRVPVTILSGRKYDELKIAFQGFSFSLVSRNGFEETPALNVEGAQIREYVSAVLLRPEVLGTIIEEKGALISLHFRHLKNESIGRVLLDLVCRALCELGLSNQWHAYPGKMVVNIEPKAVSKSYFVLSYLATHPQAFVLFAGDDSNDYPVFEIDHPRLTKIFISAAARSPARSWPGVKTLPREELLQLLEGLGSKE